MFAVWTVGTRVPSKKANGLRSRRDALAPDISLERVGRSPNALRVGLDVASRYAVVTGRFVSWMTEAAFARAILRRAKVLRTWMRGLTEVHLGHGRCCAEGLAWVIAHRPQGLIHAVRTEDVKELVETIISDSWSFPALRP